MHKKDDLPTGDLMFTVGPVKMSRQILEEAGKQPPYFRTEEFSLITQEIVSLLKKEIFTTEESEVILLTSSGTGAMEGTLMNLFSHEDKLLIIDGGSFGHRFPIIRIQRYV